MVKAGWRLLVFTQKLPRVVLVPSNADQTAYRMRQRQGALTSLLKTRKVSTQNSTNSHVLISCVIRSNYIITWRHNDVICRGTGSGESLSTFIDRVRSRLSNTPLHSHLFFVCDSRKRRYCTTHSISRISIYGRTDGDMYDRHREIPYC